MFLAGVRLSKVRIYITCLLKSDELFETGTLESVHHLQRKQYYTNILAGKSKGLLPIADATDVPRQTLELDVEPASDMLAVEDRPPDRPGRRASHAAPRHRCRGHEASIYFKM